VAVALLGERVDVAAVSAPGSKDRELAALPVGIRVSHNPNPVRARTGGRSGYGYTWLYETRVAAISEDVSIIEFGSLIRDRSHGNSWELRTIYDRPFNAAEFADWYSCPGALLRNGAICADPSNYTGSNQLQGFEMRWYFIGRARSGRLVKGEETIRCKPEIESANRD
jgi:hypothetical protein